MGRRPHTSVYPGKRVRVRLLDGTVFDDVFQDDNDRYMILRDRGKVLKRDVKALIILKGKGGADHRKAAS